ncbi:MAG: hypothetical protein K2X38_00950, partial [Gemmataceae bacterium]|nr:hypothetical protein [Gemmataceae bacterium]
VSTGATFISSRLSNRSNANRTGVRFTRPRFASRRAAADAVREPEDDEPPPEAEVSSEPEEPLDPPSPS